MTNINRTVRRITGVAEAAVILASIGAVYIVLTVFAGSLPWYVQLAGFPIGVLIGCASIHLAGTVGDWIGRRSS